MRAAIVLKAALVATMLVALTVALPAEVVCSGHTLFPGLTSTVGQSLQPTLNGGLTAAYLNPSFDGVDKFLYFGSDGDLLSSSSEADSSNLGVSQALISTSSGTPQLSLIVAATAPDGAAKKGVVYLVTLENEMAVMGSIYESPTTSALSPRFGHAMVVDGSLMGLSFPGETGGAKIFVADISTPDTPVVSSLTVGDVYGVRLAISKAAGLLVAADQDNQQLLVVDVTTPSMPVQGVDVSVPITGTVGDLVIMNSYIVLGDPEYSGVESNGGRALFYSYSLAPQSTVDGTGTSGVTVLANNKVGQAMISLGDDLLMPLANPDHNAARGILMHFYAPGGGVAISYMGDLDIPSGASVVNGTQLEAMGFALGDSGEIFIATKGNAVTDDISMLTCYNMQDGSSTSSTGSVVGPDCPASTFGSIFGALF